MHMKQKKAFTDSTLRGVPGITVNNRYLVIPDELSTIGEYVDLVNFLLKK